MGSLKTWIGGLISAASGGLAGMLGAALADGKDFNLTTADGVHKMAITAFFSAIVPVLAFLKQSPLPGVDQK